MKEPEQRNREEVRPGLAKSDAEAISIRTRAGQNELALRDATPAQNPRTRLFRLGKLAVGPDLDLGSP